MNVAAVPEWITRVIDAGDRDILLRATDPLTDRIVEAILDNHHERLCRRERLAPTALLAMAVRLAPTVETCELLLLGYEVPDELLDPVWVERYESGGAWRL